MKRILITAIYIVIFWILFPALLVMLSLMIERSVTLPTVNECVLPGLAVSVVSAAMLALSIIQFTRDSGRLPVSAYPPDHIVRKGIYAFYRHPIYLFYVTLFLGVTLVTGSSGMFFIGMPVLVVGVRVYASIEERALLRRFGKDYRAYREQAGSVIPRFHMMLSIPFRVLSRFFFPITTGNANRIPKQAPFFLVANHRNYLDPFMIASTLPFKIHYVTTYEMFRRRMIRFFFTLLGCIPKKRYMYDRTTVKKVVQVLQDGGVVGIFPEGERSYTGELLDLKLEPMKLFMKFRDIPVIPVAVSGNYIMWPRWGKGWRPCGITVTYHEPITPRPGESLESLRDRITRGITPDDTGKLTRHARRAHSIECFLYRCPQCMNFDCLSSRNNRLLCTRCGHEWELHEAYVLSDCDDGKERTINEMYSILCIKKCDVTGKRTIICSSGPCSCSIEKGGVFEPLFTGTMSLRTCEVVIQSDALDEKPIRIAMRDLLSATIEGNRKLQVFDSAARKAYQFVFTRESARKWQDYIAEARYVACSEYPIVR